MSVYQCVTYIAIYIIYTGVRCAYVVLCHTYMLMCYPPACVCADVLSSACVCVLMCYPPARVCADVHALSFGTRVC